MPHAWEDGFVGGNRRAWHDLATVIPEEVIRIAEVGKYAPKLVAPVQEWELYAVDPKTRRTVPFTDYKATVRVESDNVWVPLAPVGIGYRVVQGVESLEFMDELLERGAAKVHSAGTLELGRKYFVCCILPDTIRVQGSEPMQKFVTLANSFDGSLSLQVVRHAHRVECLNTLNMAIGSAAARYQFRHTQSIMDLINEARSELGLHHAYWSELERLGNVLVMQPFQDLSWRKLVAELLPDPRLAPGYDPSLSGHKRRVSNWEREVTTMNAICWDSDNLANIRGTAWAALNAVVEFSDYAVAGRQTKNSTLAENRIKRTLFDTSLKDRALAVIQDLVGVN